jgi:hypothetical protein
MPGKAKRSRGKHPPSKKAKTRVRQGAPATAAPDAMTAAKVAPAAPPERAPAAARTTAARPAPVTAGARRYPYFVPELKRIGILTVVIVIILVVLSLVLS